VFTLSAYAAFTLVNLGVVAAMALLEQPPARVIDIIPGGVWTSRRSKVARSGRRKDRCRRVRVRANNR